MNKFDVDKLVTVPTDLKKLSLASIIKLLKKMYMISRLKKLIPMILDDLLKNRLGCLEQ